MSTSVRTKWSRALGAAVGAAAAVALVVLAFLWPTVASSVKDLPLGVVGEPAQAQALSAQLGEQGAFDVQVLADRDEAVDQIERREIYGAVVLGAQPEVLTASAGGTAQNQMMTAVHAQLQAQAQAQAGTAVEVPLTDVVPLAASDERGVGLGAAAFPMVMGGMIGGILISTVVAGASRRLAAITTYAVLSGLVVALILQPWFGFLQGSFALNWLAISAAMLATGAFIVGANAVLGKAGIALGAVVSMLVGNPISSAAQPVEFLPGAWGAIGQYFVPGASASLLRELSYFPDASHLHEWLVLAAWIAAGVLMMTLGHFRGQEVVHIEGATEGTDEPEPALV